MRLTVAIPAYNEAAVLPETLASLSAFLHMSFDEDWCIVIADNGSTDGTDAAVRLCTDARYERCPGKGKGLAIRTAWERHPAKVMLFIDADLSADLSVIPMLVAAIEGGADIAIGSRALPRSRVERPLLRRIMSVGYRQLLRSILGMTASDPPCGVKAISPKVMAELVPMIRDDRWFFDTELLFHCQRLGWPLKEVPVFWRDRRIAGRRSKVFSITLIGEYVAGMYRLRREYGSLRP